MLLLMYMAVIVNIGTSLSANLLELRLLIAYENDPRFDPRFDPRTTPAYLRFQVSE